VRDTLGVILKNQEDVQRVSGATTEELVHRVTRA
jgi:hypothetical protein